MYFLVETFKLKKKTNSTTKLHNVDRKKKKKNK